MDKEFESSLVVLVPEADELVSPFRAQYDPAAAVGVPAHITINYPFQLDQSNKRQQISKLEDVLSCFASFRFSLAEIRQFPNSIYLAPDPEDKFKELSNKVLEHFPESPPYCGKFDEVIPHLTVAEVEYPEDIATILKKFVFASKGELPIRSEVKEVLLMDNQSGAWETRHVFSLEMVEYDHG